MGGKITTISGTCIEYKAENILLHATSGTIELCSSADTIMQSRNGITYSKYTKKDAKVTSAMSREVEEIRIITPLEEGCDYKTNGALRDGMMYGNAYELEVVKFRKNITPQNPDVIKWAYRYETEEGVIEKIFENGSGMRIRLSLHNLNICGRGLTIYAYINSREDGAACNAWVHYRFRWLSREILKDDIDKRKSKPWLIDQGDTSLCGIASIFYVFAKRDPVGYEKFILNLHQKGEAIYNSYEIKPESTLMENKKIAMPLADYVGLASTRNNENRNYKGGNEQFAAISWPWLMTKLCKSLLGYKEVISDGIYNPAKPIVWIDRNILSKIETINSYKMRGYDVILMIDSDLINDKTNYDPDYHWVVLEGLIQVNYIPGIFSPQKNEINFKVFSWGSNDVYLRNAINLKHFALNYYGFIACK